MKQFLQALVQGAALTEEETFILFEELMGEEDRPVTDAQIGAYLFSTGSRPISSAELVGGARSLRKHMLPVCLREVLHQARGPDAGVQGEIELLDTCGTGGSGLVTFNTSTAVAFVVAAGGQPVAKHGNRASTSPTGSADVLRELGVNLDLTVHELGHCIAETNFCFFFAPYHHPATKRVTAIRRELGFRTIFNFLGPLTNPASPTRQLLGVSQRSMAERMAEALRDLGSTHALVVRGEDGLDELTTTASSLVFEVSDGKVNHFTVTPEDFGLRRAEMREIEGGPPRVAATRLRAVLAGERNAHADLVALNAGAALYVSGKSSTIGEGVELAQRILSSGVAVDVLERVIKLTQSFKR